MRIRVHFAKNEAMRYTSHLDLHRAWERTIRRAGLPLAYSQGFRPHPRINIASALPLGFTSQDEVLDVWLEKSLTLEQIEHDLKESVPPGIQIQSIDIVPEKEPALQTQLQASKYIITILEPIPNLDSRLQTLMETSSLPRQKRGKTYDLRPLIFELHRLPDDDEGLQRMEAVLSAQAGATGRPEEVILALDSNPQRARIHRMRLIFDFHQHTISW